MPSKTFFNLSNEKREKLISAATLEFSQTTYQDVSINKIIMNASIPRGSFYMYFKDLNDLFEYIINLNKNKLYDLIKKSFIKEEGDLKKAFIIIYDKALNNIKKYKSPVFFKNIFIFLNLQKERFNHPGHMLYNDIKDYISINNLKSDDLEFIFSMFVHNLFVSISDTMKNNNFKLSREKYLRKIDIICYGIYKEKK